MRSLCLLAALAACACAGQPRDPIVACGAGGTCPAGMICTSDNTCWTVPPLPPPPPLRASITLTPANALTVSWEPVPGAVDYVVDVNKAAAPPRSATSITFPYLAPGRIYEVGITSENEFGAGGRAVYPKFLSHPSPPGVGVIRAEAGVEIYWNHTIGNVSILKRGMSADGPFTEVARATDLFTHVTDIFCDGPCFYIVEDTVGSLTAVSPPASILGSPASPVPHGTCADGTVTLEWTPVPGATSYELYASTGSYDWALVATTTDARFSGPANLSRQGLLYRVLAVLGSRRFPPSLTGELPSGLRFPERVTLTTNGTVDSLTWTQVAGAESYELMETQSNSPPISTQSTSWQGQIPVPVFFTHAYQVRAKSRCGQSLPSSSDYKFGWSPIDQAGPPATTPVTLDLSISPTPGQAFTVGTSGTLDAIEVSAAQSGYEHLELYTEDGLLLARVYEPVAVARGTYWAPAPLTTVGSGAVFAFPSGSRRVAAGQRLVFKLRGDFFVGSTPDAYSGGAETASGLPVRGSLLFRTFVTPSDAGLAPSSLVAEAGVQQAHLAWDADPRATSYDVLRDLGSGFSAIASVTQPSYIDRDTGSAKVATYQIRSQPDGLQGQPASVLLPFHLDASNLGGPDERGNADATPGDLGQKFTVERGGLLRSIELAMYQAAPNPPSSVRVQLFDARSGHSLADSYLPAGPLDICCGPSALDKGAFGLAVFPFDNQNVQLTPGQEISFVVSAPGRRVADTNDTYPGGTELRGGSPVAGRDLVFKVIVQ